MSKTNFSLHTIENVNSIKQLAPFYDLISKHARMLYKGNDDYEDLVQELFLKLDKYFTKYPEKIINGGFISNSLRNMIRNKHKAKTRCYIDYNVEVNDSIIDEDSLTVLDVDNEVIHEKLSDEQKYDIIEQKLSELTWVERTVLEYSLIMSLKEMSRLSEIPYQNLVYALTRAKDKLGIKK